MVSKRLIKTNSDYLLTNEDKKKLRSYEKKYSTLICQSKEKGKFDSQKYYTLLWRNMLRTLPLLKLEDSSNKKELVKDNQFLLYIFFCLLDMALLKTISEDKEYEKLKKYKNGSHTYSNHSYFLRAIFKDYAEIFFIKFDVSYEFQPISKKLSFTILLIEKFLGVEKAEKYEREIEFELDNSKKKELLSKEDFGEYYESSIECMKNNGFGYFGDYVEKHFENDLMLNAFDKETIKKRVIIFLTAGYIPHGAFSNEHLKSEIISLIELSERLNFPADEVGELITHARKNNWSFDNVKEQMECFKESRMNIDSYITAGNLHFVNHKIRQIFKILHPDFSENFTVSSGGIGYYKILITPKEALCPIEIHQPKTNKIVHFSSFDKLKFILKEKAFRLYNAYNSDDKSEFSNWLDNFDIDADKLKRETYIGSFCDSKILSDNEKASVMWCKYGKEGKGVAIKFKTANDINTKTYESGFSGEIIDFFLGKVSYNPIEEDRLKRFESEFDKFRKNYNCHLNVLDCIFPFAFITKQTKFEFENEIRLFKAKHWSNKDMAVCEEHGDENCNCLVKYYEVPLFRKEEGKIKLIISEIQFGPNLTDSEYEQRKNEIEKIFTETKINGDYPIPVFSKSTIIKASYNSAVKKHSQENLV